MFIVGAKILNRPRIHVSQPVLLLFINVVCVLYLQCGIIAAGKSDATGLVAERLEETSAVVAPVALYKYFTSAGRSSGSERAFQVSGDIGKLGVIAEKTAYDCGSFPGTSFSVEYYVEAWQLRRLRFVGMLWQVGFVVLSGHGFPECLQTFQPVVRVHCR